MADRAGFEHRQEPPADPRPRSSIGDVRFFGLEARVTSGSRRRWARSTKTGFDPERKSMALDTYLNKSRS